jgi:uncharacterized membrane protein YphA (DoxX/SURF4 family)
MPRRSRDFPELPSKNCAVAWAFVHHFQFFGAKGDHGELIVNYLGATATLFLIGGGRYSLDHLLKPNRLGG